MKNAILNNLEFEELKKKMHDHANRIYNEIAPDLPEYGRGDQHVLTAIDHIADRLSDKFSHTAPNRKIAEKVVHGYVGTHKDEEQAHRNWVKEKKLNDIKKRAAEKVADAYKRMMAKRNAAPKRKPKRGIGSY